MFLKPVFSSVLPHTIMIHKSQSRKPKSKCLLFRKCGYLCTSVSLCIYRVTILYGFWLKVVRHPDGLWNGALLRPWWKSCSGLWCDVTSIFYTSGADGVHLSAGAQDGHGDRCQVERCPDLLCRWMETHINLLYAVQMWTINLLTTIQQQH